jgi:hypothetical protein
MDERARFLPFLTSDFTDTSQPPLELTNTIIISLL